MNSLLPPALSAIPPVARIFKRRPWAMVWNGTSFALVSIVINAGALVGVPVVAAESLSPIGLHFDFREGTEGWSAVFSDYPVEQEEDVDQEAGLRPLPLELGDDRSGFFVAGNNISDDLMKLLKRRLGPEDGIESGRTYVVEFVIQFASVLRRCSSGSNDVLRAGASPVEPRTVVRTRAGIDYHRMNFDFGDSVRGGLAATLAGNATNDLPCDSPATWATATRSVRHLFPVTANEVGELWLVVLTDSTWESYSSVYFLSISVTLTPTAVGGDASIANLSTRGTIRNDDNMIAGFVVEGTVPRRLLLRAVGPELARFEVNEPLPNPTLELYDAAGSSLVFNNDWNLATNLEKLREAMLQTDAFPLTEDSRDAAILATLPPGLYTAVMRSSDSGNTVSPIGLVEIYDAGTGETGERHLVNLSTRGTVGLGYDNLIPGLVVVGPNPVRLLLRAVGPGLARHGVDQFFPDPALHLYQGQTVVASDDDWGDSADVESIAQAAVATGAFALMPEEADAALLVNLPPGIYTVDVGPSIKYSFSSGRESGTCLVEVYRVPSF